jgi:RNA polymerase sigma-70 factor (ECF subfamily)
MTDDPVVIHRSLLFTVAYEMLGSAADAEDVVQESWLRWADLGVANQAAVRDPRAYLIRVVTRQALNRLRTQVRRREDYVGPWLPEPLLTSPDVAEDVELADSISFAMLTVLETLGPWSGRCSCSVRCSRRRTTRSRMWWARRRPGRGRSPTVPEST